MANVTISIDDDLINRGRQYARLHNTSLNALIRRLLKNTVESGTDNWLREYFDLADQVNANSKGKKWTRDELYDV